MKKKRHAFTHEEAIAAGKKGGMVTAKNKKHMIAAGRKGAEARWGKEKKETNSGNR